MSSIKQTVSLDLCVSCGICKVTCPVNAIIFEFAQGQYLPVVGKDCNDCGLCLKVCPGYEVKFKDLYHHENRDLPEDIFLGHVIESYVSYTKDEVIRKNSASGGMVTSLIVELVKHDFYKGAFILPFDKATTDLAKLHYTTNLEEVISASKSKYLPASAENVASMIEQLSSPIIVGTSCQIHGIKKYCIERNVDCSNALFLGLFCEKTLNYNFLTYYEWKYGKGKKLEQFDYRNKEKDGWPGHTKLTFSDNKEIFVNRKVRMNLKKYFQLKRCLFCIDKFNQLADISFGDCYIKGEETELGQSNIIIRTEKGTLALEAFKEKFVLRSVDAAIIAGTQKIESKQMNASFCILLDTEQNHNIYPEIQQKLKPNIDNSIAEKNYNEAMAMINLGISEYNFVQVDNSTKIIKLKKLLIKIANKFIKGVGIKQ